jgi:hypothetical protein
MPCHCRTRYESTPTIEFAWRLILEACVLLFARIGSVRDLPLANVTRRRAWVAMARQYRLVNSQMTASGQCTLPASAWVFFELDFIAGMSVKIPDRTR